MNNPYSEIYSMMRSAPGDGQAGAPIHIRLGRVLSASPLKVDVAGTTQEAGRFYIARRLLEGYGEQVSIRGEASGSFAVSAFCDYGKHSALTIESGAMELSGAMVTQAGAALQRGDLVLLLTEDDQTFYLMDKVVHL